MTTIMNCKKLGVGYKKSGKIVKNVISNINLDIEEGKFIAILGPNGTGKSTLMKTLCRILPPITGTITLNNIPLKKYRLRELAQNIGLVLTDRINVGSMLVKELVAIGRHPYTNWIGKYSKKDENKIENAIESVGITDLKDRHFNELSDGEKQKILIARALAQDPNFIFLDEPTSHLDFPSKVEVMQLLSSLVKDKNITVLIATHELHLALQTADVVWLISESGDIFIGPPEQLILDGIFESVFNRNDVVFDIEDGTFHLNKRPHGTIRIKGTGYISFWTAHALERIGFNITKRSNNFDFRINIEHDAKKYYWIVQKDSKTNTFTNLKDLISYTENIIKSKN